MKNGVN